MNFSGKKVLVTGAAGFIGSHLTERLVREGADVRAMVHYNSASYWNNLELIPNKVLNEVDVFSGDVTDPFSVQKAVKERDIVFHLASLIAIPYSYVAPQSYVQTNIIGAVNIMQACMDNNVSRIVHTSTSETYGTAQHVPIDEEHPLKGQSPYSATKIGADKIAESYYLSFNLPVSTIRPFNTYGPRQSNRAVIPTIISQILAGKKEIQLGSLSPQRDFNYVADTVSGFLAVADSDKSMGEVINVGAGKTISIGELAALIMDVIGTNVIITEKSERLRPEKSEVLRLMCDNAKAKELCNWEPQYSLRDGLKETVEFVRNNMDRFKTDIYGL